MKRYTPLFRLFQDPRIQSNNPIMFQYRVQAAYDPVTIHPFVLAVPRIQSRLSIGYNDLSSVWCRPALMWADPHPDLVAAGHAGYAGHSVALCPQMAVQSPCRGSASVLTRM